MTFYLWLFDLINTNSLDGQIVSEYTGQVCCGLGDTPYKFIIRWLGIKQMPCKKGKRKISVRVPISRVGGPMKNKKKYTRKKKYK